MTPAHFLVGDVLTTIPSIGTYAVSQILKKTGKSMAKKPTALPTYPEQIVQGIPESPSNKKQMEKSSSPFT